MEYGSPNSKGRTVKHKQFLVTATDVGGAGGTTGNITEACATMVGEGVPYTVPSGYALILLHAYFDSKFGAFGRSAYACIQQIITITDVEPQWNGIAIIPPGGVLNVSFINNKNVDEFGNTGGLGNNMMLWIDGALVDCPSGTAYDRILDGLDV